MKELLIYDKIWKKLNPNPRDITISKKRFRDTLRRIQISNEDAMKILEELLTFQIVEYNGFGVHAKRIRVRGYKDQTRPFIVHI